MKKWLRQLRKENIQQSHLTGRMVQSALQETKAVSVCHPPRPELHPATNPPISITDFQTASRNDLESMIGMALIIEL